MKYTYLFALLLIVLTNHRLTAQNTSSKEHIATINSAYSKALSLTEKQSQEFKTILIKYNKQLSLLDSQENKQKYNKVLKLQDLEIYSLLTKEQFSKYKAIKTNIEPYKKYKI